MKQVLIVAILILVPEAAWAQADTRAVQQQVAVIGDPHFTFTTSVTIQSLHEDVEAAAMECEVGKNTPPAGIIGDGLQTFSLDGTGSYSGNVVVKIRADAGKDPADGNYYNCSLVLRKKGTTEWVNPNPNGETWQRPKPGVQFISGGEGAIP